MPRANTHIASVSTARRFSRPPLASLIALTVAAGSLVSAPGALAQPKGTPAPKTCDGWPIGTVRSTKVTTFTPSGPVTTEKWEECGSDGKWAPTAAPTIARPPHAINNAQPASTSAMAAN
jgi:hypothetical protein